MSSCRFEKLLLFGIKTQELGEYRGVLGGNFRFFFAFNYKRFDLEYGGVLGGNFRFFFYFFSNQKLFL